VLLGAACAGAAFVTGCDCRCDFFEDFCAESSALCPPFAGADFDADGVAVLGAG
jgi:hypothetical protein